MRLSATCILAAIGLAGCAVEPACHVPAPLARLKLEQRNDKLFTHVRINGGDALMVIDTGAYRNLLTLDAAQRLGLPSDDSLGGWARGLGGTVEFTLASAREVAMGIGSVQGVRFAVLRHGEAAGPLAGLAPVDGLLGMDNLNAADLDLDLWGGTFGLYAPLPACAAAVTALAPPVYAVTLQELADDPRPIVDVVVNGHRIRALIDTGAPASLIYAAAAERVGLGQAALAQQSFSAHGIGPLPVPAQNIDGTQVQVGVLVLTDLTLAVVHDVMPPRVDMVLGLDFVSRVHVWISHSTHELVMQYPPRATSGG